MNGDTYKRREVSPGVYQCGCRWDKWEGGDILRQCALHQAHTAHSVRRFDAERATPIVSVKEG